MAINTTPAYTLRGDQSRDNGTTMSTALTAAAADYDGTGANNTLIHTAGTSGSFVRGIRCRAKGTNVASVLRVFINNGATNGTATNNALVGEVSLPATTASATSATVDIYLPIGQMLKSGWRIYVGLGTAVAAGWVAVCDAGQYE